MSDPTQASPGDEPPTAPVPAPGADAPVSTDRVFEGRDIQRGLWLWMAIIVAGAIGSTLLGHVEGAVLFAGAGAFALAQASDAASALERYRLFVDHGLPQGSLHGGLVRWLIGALVPIAGAFFYLMFGLYAWHGAGERPMAFAAIWCACAVVTCLLLAWRPFADAIMREFFHGTPGRTRRLTARLVVIALLLPAPAFQVMPSLLATLVQGDTTLADAPSLIAQLLGELAIAFAGVGLFVRRDWHAVRERLGLTAMRPRDYLVVVAGVVGAIALNGGTEWIEHHLFPALWKQDAYVTGLIAARMPLATSLLLGVSAGFGEELAIRGALQPRLGIPLSALLFASGHVQYSWFGMLTVGLLGVLLGVIRKRTNTTTAIVVHALYDIFAAVTTV